MNVFVDTSAWLALYDRSDQHHRAALRIADELKAQRATLTLSDFVLAESLTLIRFRVGHSWAVRFGQVILESRVADIVEVDHKLRRRAWDIFRQYEDKDFSFVDCSSFALMEHLGVTASFAFDRHFEQYGFPSLQSLGQ
jgi:predicted nucleic acid-binding protein